MCSAYDLSQPANGRSIDMESMKSGIRGFSRLSARKKAIAIAALALIAVLFVALCISIGMRANIQPQGIRRAKPSTTTCSY